MRYPLGLLTPSGVLRKLRDNRRYGARAPLLREVIHIDPAAIAGFAQNGYGEAAQVARWKAVYASP